MNHLLGAAVLVVAVREQDCSPADFVEAAVDAIQHHSDVAALVVADEANCWHAAIVGAEHLHCGVVPSQKSRCLFCSLVEEAQLAAAVAVEQVVALAAAESPEVAVEGRHVT